MQGNISFTGDLSGSITGEGGGGVPHITATASVDPNTGIPEVSVSRSGTDENPNFAFAFKNLKGSQGIQGLPGQNGQNGVDGTDGEDGVSPVIFVTDITGGHRVKIIDVDHPLGQTFDVMNGINGQNGADGSDGSDGADGYSPVVTITDITGGHRVNITDEQHPSGQNFDVMNGQNGQQGEQGQQGEPGVGVPAGGSIGQVLTKLTTMDYQTGWTDLSGDDVAYDSNDSVNDKIDAINASLTQKISSGDVIRGTKSVTAGAGAYGSESVNIPWNTTDYTIVLSIEYSTNFTNAHVAYRYKGTSSVAVGFYNAGGSSLTLNVDYIIIKN